MSRVDELKAFAFKADNVSQRFGVLSDIERRIQQCQEALDLTPEGPDRAGRLQNLGATYLDRYQLTKAPNDLELSIRLHQESLDLTPEGPERAGRLYNVGLGYGQRYRLAGAPSDLEVLIQHCQEALDLARKGPNRAGFLQTLAVAYGHRYDLTEALDDIMLAIRLHQEALDLTPKDNPARASQLCNLGIDYTRRYNRLGNLSDLEAVIQCSQEAVDLTPDDHSKRDVRLWYLAIGHANRYRRLGNLSDLEVAIQLFQQVLDLTASNNPERARRLKNLGVCYRNRYKRLGIWSDLEAAIQNEQQATELTPDNHPGKAAQLQNLAAGYQDRYNWTGILADLELSIQLNQRAVDLTPESHPDRKDRFRTLAMGYQARYQRIGALSDLELCIQLFQKAVDLTPENHSSRADKIQALAAACGKRYRRTRALSDLELCIQLSREAVDLTPDGDPDAVIQLGVLAAGYNDRYRQAGVIDDLELSIQLSQKAVDLTPKDDPGRAVRLQNLATGYRNRYRRAEALDDLELSIQLYQEALDVTPKDHLDRASRLLGLGIGYRDQYQRTGLPMDLELSIRQFQEALNSKWSHLLDRLHAGVNLFDAHVEIGNWQSACDAASLTVSLIPLITSRSLERSDIQHRVDEIIGIASDATAIALRVGKEAYEAIQFLELGRGIIASSLGDMRTDITDLNEKFPDLAEHFNSLRNLLDNPTESKRDTQRYNTGKQLEELIQRIRSLPGFDRFLLVPSEDEIRRATTHGPIVIVNVSGYGCHALIMEQKGFRALELPFPDIQDIPSKADELASPSAEMLGWLWDRVANPVLTSLNFVQTPEHTWPRVWWILTGPLARFPIHAAGRYFEGEGEIHATVMDRVVSSYSSSVRAIVDAYRNSSAPINSSKEESIVLVGMEQTPGYDPLEFAQKEIQVLTKLGGSMQLQVKQPLSRQKETLSALSGCKIFHFAGHGYTDLVDPSRSALLLSDGKVTVNSIFEINLHQNKPFLAYLSACGTGQVKHENLIDEGVHLIGAFQLAGFRHVIGTLWEVNDKSCVDIARMTYEWIQEHGLSDSSVSEGLHHACRKLRSQWVQENEMRAASRRGTQSERSIDAASTQEQSRSAQTGTRNPRDAAGVDELPMHWVPYVHFGP